MIKPIEIQIRFSDVDVMGHVNNAVYLSYFEYTRLYYFEALVGPQWNWIEQGILLVKKEVEDKATIEMSIGEIGNKSFTFHYELRVNDLVYTKALSTLVCYNSKESKTITIPEKMKYSFSQLKKQVN